MKNDKEIRARSIPVFILRPVAGALILRECLRSSPGGTVIPQLRREVSGEAEADVTVVRVVPAAVRRAEVPCASVKDAGQSLFLFDRKMYRSNIRTQITPRETARTVGYGEPSLSTLGMQLHPHIFIGIAYVQCAAHAGQDSY
jgi:hypothetical protein